MGAQPWAVCSFAHVQQHKLRLRHARSPIQNLSHEMKEIRSPSPISEEIRPQLHVPPGFGAEIKRK
jgi:hypothetical protein